MSNKKITKNLKFDTFNPIAVSDKSIVVGMSGGIDSCASALLLKRAGWEPIGLTLKFAKWQNRTGEIADVVNRFEESAYIAKEVCERLRIPHFIYDACSDFQSEVIDYFKSQLKIGKTPNPCLVCNRCVKYKTLIQWADAHSIHHVACGHYAKISKKENGKFGLFMAKDNTKDQTYGLCMLKQEQLQRIVLPLANYTKEQVRVIVNEVGFDFFSKIKQSQDLCFVSSLDYHNFLKSELGSKTGNIIDSNSKILGTHNGLHFYTRGQRCGVPGGTIYYVNKFDVQNNTIIATSNKDDLMQKEFNLKHVNYISGNQIFNETKITAKIRHGAQMGKATFYPTGKNSAKVVFDVAQFAPMSGQFCALYVKDECLGGGEIV